MIETIISFGMLIGFWVYVFGKYVKPRFPRLTPLKFGVAAFFATVGLSIAVVAFLTTDSSLCRTTEAAILLEESPLPFVKKSATPKDKEAKLITSCEMHLRQCNGQTSRETARVNEICEPYR